MTCEEAKRLLLDDLTGRLGDRGRTDLREHLDACTRCRETADAQVEVARTLASRPAAAPRPDFAARLRRRIDEESGWFGVADWRWLSVRLAPVAGLLLLTAGIVVGRQATEAPVQPSLSEVVETWASGGSDQVPVTSVLWQQEPSEDAALLTVLAAPSDATIARESNER